MGPNESPLGVGRETPKISAQPALVNPKSRIDGLSAKASSSASKNLSIFSLTHTGGRRLPIPKCLTLDPRPPPTPPPPRSKSPRSPPTSPAPCRSRTPSRRSSRPRSCTTAWPVVCASAPRPSTSARPTSVSSSRPSPRPSTSSSSRLSVPSTTSSSSRSRTPRSSASGLVWPRSTARASPARSSAAPASSSPTTARTRLRSRSSSTTSRPVKLLLVGPLFSSTSFDDDLHWVATTAVVEDAMHCGWRWLYAMLSKRPSNLYHCTHKLPETRNRFNVTSLSHTTSPSR